MGKLTKNKKSVSDKFEPNKLYTVEEASSLIKEITTTKFDASVDLAVRLGVDPKKANQMVRGVVSLPHGTGKDMKVLALVTPDKEQEAKDAGADFVGLDEYLDKIKSGWTDVDVIVTMPSVMPKLGPLGKVLGPRGLMPNPKLGTVTADVKLAVEAAKSGQVQYRAEKNGLVQAGVGKVSFGSEKITENINSFIDAVQKARPSGAKGTFIKKISISSTMGAGININM